MAWELDFLTGGGEMGALMRAHDWTATPVGPPATWPRPLKSTIRLLLNTGHPMYVWWGQDLLCFYNDAFSRSLGPEQHPTSLGKPGREVWAEIWPQIGDQVTFVMTGLGSTWDENRPVPITRHGRLDEIYWTYSYSPIDDETSPNGVGGVLVICSETTSAVLNARHQSFEKARQRLLFDQAPGFIAALVGPEHRFEFVNATYRRLFGDRDYVGNTVRDVFPELIDQQFFELLDRVYTKGERYLAERTQIRVQNSAATYEERYLDFMYEPVLDEAERVTGVFVEGHDVTDRVLSERRHAFQVALDEQLRNIADPTALIDAACEALGQHLGAGQVAYAEVEPGGDTVWIDREWNDGMRPSNVGRHRLNDFGLPFIADLKAGRTIVIPDVSLDPRTSSPEAIATFDRVSIGGFINVPLVEEGGLVAVLAVHSASARIWAPEDVTLVVEVAARIWLAAQRARAEMSLRDAEERYLALFNAIDQGFCTIEVAFDEGDRAIDYRFLEVSPSFERQTGITNGAGRWMREIASDQDEHWFDTYGDVAISGEPARFEAYSTPLGRWWDVYAFRIRGPLRIAVLFRDITDQKRAQAALRKSEARLRLSHADIERQAAELRELNETLEFRVTEAIAERKLLADVVDGTDAFVQVADLKYRWLAINKAACNEFEHIFGVRPKVGDSMLDLLAHRPDHLAAVKAVWARALAGEEFSEVGEFGDPSRKRRFYEMKFNALRDEQGQQRGAYQFVYDVTDRIEEQQRVAEAQAARSQADALYRAYFANATDALFVIGVLADGAFTVEDVNPAYQANSALPLALGGGTRVYDALSADFTERVSAPFRRVVASGETARYRELFVLDGETTHWETVLVPVRDPKGRVVRLFGSSRDLTRQLAAEEQLQQTQKMEAMGQLTGGVAHDFNNLLTPILGSLDMLVRREVGNERERRLIGGALQSAERAKTLVQRLLAFARRQPLQSSAVDVAALVQHMTGLIESTLGPTIQVRVASTDALPPAQADPHQLEMALLNLAVNARDAMPDGGELNIETSSREVRAGLEVKLLPGRYVLLCVTDNGTGMDARTLARAVEPFFSTKGIGRGTGLGLSMVHGLAAQLGGALVIDSALGRGTTIELWLPESVEPVGIVDAIAPGKGHPAGRGKALLVDDEDLARMSTADMLMDMGFEVLEAVSAEDALLLVESGTEFEILVTDHLMPGMSGADLALRLRERFAGLPVLIVSGYAEAEGIASDLPRLTKPFRSDELADQIAGLLHGTSNRN